MAIFIKTCARHYIVDLYEKYIMADPLAQRATVGWKATQTAEILNGENLIRFECVSSNSATAEEN